MSFDEKKQLILRCSQEEYSKEALFALLHSYGTAMPCETPVIQKPAAPAKMEQQAALPDPQEPFCEHKGSYQTNSAAHHRLP